MYIRMLAKSSNRPFLKLDKNVNMQNIFKKYFFEVTSIITFDCCDNHSDIQQSSTCKAGSAHKLKIHVELAILHLQQFLFRKSFAECFT